MTPTLPLNVEVLWKEGIPKDTLIVRVPHTGYWLEFKKWKNDCYRVCLCDPMKDTKRVVAQSASYSACSLLMDMALIPHKEPRTPDQFLSFAKETVKSEKVLGSTQPKKVRNTGKSSSRMSIDPVPETLLAQPSQICP